MRTGIKEVGAVADDRRMEMSPPQPGDEPAGPRASLDAEALRRLRLGQGRAEDQYLSAGPSVGVVVPVRQYSRVRGGPTAFGPVGRVLASLLIVGVLWLLLNPLTLPLLVPGAVILLRGIWRRELQPTPILRDQRTQSPRD